MFAAFLTFNNNNKYLIIIIQVLIISPSVLQERALHYVDETTNGDVKVTEGVEFVQTEEVQAGGRSLNEINLSSEPEARENEVDSLLVDRVARFLGSHTLQFKVPKDSIQDMQRSLEEGNYFHFLFFSFNFF